MTGICRCGLWIVRGVDENAVLPDPGGSGVRHGLAACSTISCACGLTPLAPDCYLYRPGAPGGAVHTVEGCPPPSGNWLPLTVN